MILGGAVSNRLSVSLCVLFSESPNSGGGLSPPSNVVLEHVQCAYSHSSFLEESDRENAENTQRSQTFLSRISIIRSYDFPIYVYATEPSLKGRVLRGTGIWGFRKENRNRLSALPDLKT